MLIDARQQCGEPVVAVADQQIPGSELISQYLADRRQGPVSCNVSEPVVKGSELINIHHNQRNRLIVFYAAFDFARKCLLHCVTVVQPG